MSSKLFHKAFSNRSIITAGEGGITKPEHPNQDTKKQKIKLFLKKLQAHYKTTKSGMLVPSEIERDINRIRFYFNIEKDNIENMLKFLENQKFKPRNFFQKKQPPLKARKRNKEELNHKIDTDNRTQKEVPSFEKLVKNINKKKS